MIMKPLLFLLLALVGCAHRPAPVVALPKTVYFLLEGSRHEPASLNIRTIYWAHTSTNVVQWIMVNRPEHRRLPGRSGLYGISDSTWLKILPVTIPDRTD